MQKIINIGCDISSSNASLEISKQFPGIVYATAAIHPSEPDHFDDFEKLSDLVMNHRNDIVAIGETGLDYYWHPETREEQITLFHNHIALAQENNKPIIVHCRDAYEDCLQIISQYPEITFIMHSFNGDMEDIERYLPHKNIIFGINGIVTFKNAPVLREVVDMTPMDRIVLETDCPYLAPEPYRGKTNKPGYIPYIAKIIADIKGVTIETVAENTTKTATTIFSL